MSKCDVVIVGAGPYGISAAAHLRTIKGLEVRVFGEPMSFWEQNMPLGMLLRSNWSATQIAHPEGALRLEEFQTSTGRRFGHPVPVEAFIEYGRWFQKQAVPDLEHRKVVRIEKLPGAFHVTTEEGEKIKCRRVVVATGIGLFTNRPKEFDRLPPSMVSHSSEHHDLTEFAGKRVIVVGGGQSALESAALLHEHGAQVEVIARTHNIHWLQGALSITLHSRLGSAVRKLLYAPTDVGPAGLSQLLARPDLVRKLPRSVQDRLRRRAVRPAGSRWLVKRLENVPIRLGCSIVSASPIGQSVQVKLHDGTTRTGDRIILGTGYRVDIAKYNFLDPNLVSEVERNGGFPVLRSGLETSVRGLHILGAPAVWSFGPLMQFVSGAHYACASLTKSCNSRSAHASPVLAPVDAHAT
ncbi:MAG: FAD-dependent oxidoreductase [Terriglobales bacterium]